VERRSSSGRDGRSEARTPAGLRVRVARYLSKYMSKERASEWLREKVGQRVFYVAPWLSRAAGASMRIAWLGRRERASDHMLAGVSECSEMPLTARRYRARQLNVRRLRSRLLTAAFVARFF
jgi:hypothetical protein